jgi:hypothetical protein
VSSWASSPLWPTQVSDLIRSHISARSSHACRMSGISGARIDLRCVYLVSISCQMRACWMSTKHATHMTGIMTGMPCLSSIPLVTWLLGGGGLGMG